MMVILMNQQVWQVLYIVCFFFILCLMMNSVMLVTTIYHTRDKYCRKLHEFSYLQN